MAIEINIPKPPFINWAEKSANYNLVNNDGVLADTLTASFTVTLPANPSLGDTIAFSDAKSNFDVNNLIIARNGNLIQGQADDLIVDVKDASFMLIYTGSTSGWKLDTFLEQTIDPINYVPSSRTINGLDLTVDRTLTTANIADSVDARYVTDRGRDIANNTWRYIDASDSAPITGTTVNTIIRSVLIPANTLTSNSVLRVLQNEYEKVGTNNTILRMYINDSNSLIGASLLAQRSNYAGLYFQQRRKFKCDGSFIKGYNAILNFALESENLGSLGSRTAVDITVDNWLIFAVQLSNSGDSIINAGLDIEICTQ